MSLMMSQSNSLTEMTCSCCGSDEGVMQVCVDCICEGVDE